MSAATDEGKGQGEGKMRITHVEYYEKLRTPSLRLSIDNNIYS